MKNNLLRVLAIKSFLYLFLAEIFSQIAMNMVNFVLIIIAFRLTHSNAAVSGIVLSYTIPAIALGLLAGIFVDRWHKKNVLLWTNLLRAFLLFGLVFLHINVVWLYIFSFLVAILTQFFIPAETPMIPLLVPKDMLLAANALFGMGVYGSVLIAYALSGSMLLIFSQTQVLIVLSILFMLAAFFVQLIQTPQKKVESLNHVSIKQEFQQAIHLILQTEKIFHSMLLLTLSQIIVLILAVIGPGYATEILRIRVVEFPLLFVTPAAIGMVVGAVIIDNYLHNFSREKSATIGVILSGIAIVLLPYGSKFTSREFIHTLNHILPNFLNISILHIMVVLAFLLGLGNAFVFVPSNTLIQEVTSDEVRGKIYGALNSLVGLGSLIPIIVVGELADKIGVGRVITGIGIIILAIGLIRIILNAKTK